MSKIYESLEKIKREAGGTPSADASRSSRGPRILPESAVPLSRRKTIAKTSERHHIDEEELVRCGLLAPPDQALFVADEFRRIKRPLIDNFLKNLGREASDHNNLIMIAGAAPGVGKTFCSVNLARSISQERDLSVLLIDADVAKPHISNVFGLADEPGLIDVLEDDVRSIESVLVRTDLNDIQVLPAGRWHSHSTELLASDRMALLMHEVATRYSDRLIIMDSPPLLATSEAQVAARQAGQIALVVESGKTTDQEIRAAIELLDPDKAINIILNKSPYSQVGDYYGGYYGSRYGDRYGSRRLNEES
jgi:exopolysaccharide/PEP-CTERM locus tyrosine autokinase